MPDPPTIFERSADAVKLHQELLLTPIGGTVTYLRLSDALGKPVGSGCSALRTARRAALSEDKAVFGCIRLVGLKRLDDEGVIDLCSAETGGVRRHARRVGHKLGAADFLKLRERSQTRAIALASVLAVVCDLARGSSVTRVAKAASGRASELPIRETLRALGFGP